MPTWLQSWRNSNQFGAPMAERNLIERLLTALRDHGARAIFGIPGDYALPMFRIIEDTKILPLYTLSHEPGVAYAADAAARIGRGVGVVAVTYGAGALNLLNAVAAAYVEHSPLVVISAAPPKRHGPASLGVHHQVRSLGSQLRMFREVTCSQAVLDDPERAPELIARTLVDCVEKSMPVYFEIPMDIAAQRCGPIKNWPAHKADRDAVTACAREIANLIQNAKQPVLMVGVEVRRFGLEDEVAELIRLTNIPAVSSLMGRGVVSGHLEQVSLSYLGLAGDPEVASLVEESDCLILLGVILSDTNLGVPAHRLDLRRVVHAFGGEVRVAHHVYPHLPLRDLVLGLSKLGVKKKENSLPRTSAARRRYLADEQPAAPSDIAAAINELFLRHGPMPLTCDIGDSLFVSLEIEYVDLLAQGYYASMGFAVPAALGIQAVSGKRPLVLVGDGAFQMTGWELGNCQRYNLDPIVVVLNNRSWEMLRVFDPEAGFNDLSDWHFADMAPSLGGLGHRVRTRAELGAALETAWNERGKFQIIEVTLDRGVTSDSLRRFVNGLNKRKKN
jgi:indolepyruvate decarboxylase